MGGGEDGDKLEELLRQAGDIAVGLAPPPPLRGAGTDLTTLGLNLNSSDCLYATFASPWADSPAQRDPEFNLPQCYYMQPPALKTVTLTPTRGNPGPNQGLPYPYP